MSARTKMSDLTGRVVNNGRYKLVQVLGSGSYGVVYEAVDLAPRGRREIALKDLPRVAIKVMLKDGMDDAQKKRIRREVLAHGMMSEHAGVVALRDVFESKRHISIVLDYCPGGDLFTQISDHNRYFRQDDLLKSVFLQILDAVDACHRKRIYHRDLKPENVLTTADGTQAWLTDFGLVTSNIFSETFGCGSSNYMSPQCLGKETRYTPYSNSANDVWALGIILINMVTCRSPWNKALKSDPCFSDFLTYDDYLLHMLPISTGANQLFRHVFACEPVERVTIPELRQAIIDLDTFFMTDEEISYAGEAVQVAASYCGVHVEPAKRVRNASKGASPEHIKEVDSLPPRTPANLFGSSGSRIASDAAFIIGESSEEGEVISSAEPELSDGSSASDSSIPETPCGSQRDNATGNLKFDLQLSEFGHAASVVEKKVDQLSPPRGLCIVNVQIEVSE